MSRFDEYRVMWVFVFFDLPTETKKEQRIAAKFRKDLIGDGFIMFQYSIYIRNCPSFENASAHVGRVRKMIPESGKVGIIRITDKQFSDMELYVGKKMDSHPAIGQQLELF